MRQEKWEPAYIKAPCGGKSGNKGGLMWLEECSPRASDRESSSNGGLKLDLKELYMPSLGKTHLQQRRANEDL